MIHKNKYIVQFVVSFLWFDAKEAQPRNFQVCSQNTITPEAINLKWNELVEQQFSEETDIFLGELCSSQPNIRYGMQNCAMNLFFQINNLLC